MNKQSSAVLLMAFGTPLSDDQLLPYYTDIRSCFLQRIEQS